MPNHKRIFLCRISITNYPNYFSGSVKLFCINKMQDTGGVKIVHACQNNL
jgi:hypothetical protein